MFQDEELSAKLNCHRVPSSPLLTDIDMISLPLSIWLAFTLYYQIIRKYVFFFPALIYFENEIFQVA